MGNPMVRMTKSWICLGLLVLALRFYVLRKTPVSGKLGPLINYPTHGWEMAGDEMTWYLLFKSQPINSMRRVLRRL